MVYKTGTNYALVRRSISGRPLRGGVHTFTPQRPKQTVRPAQYIDAKMLSVHLPEILRKDEHLQAVVYGAVANGTGLFAATSERIIVIERSARFTRVEDISLRMLAGMDLKRQGALTLLSIFTNTDIHTVRTLDRASARHFVESVDVCYQTRIVDRELW